MKRLISIILSCAFALTLTAAVLALDEQNNAGLITEEYIIRNYYVDQSEAVNAYYNFISTLSSDEEGNHIWPLDFGGAYIDDEANLVIHVKNLTEERRQWYVNACQSSSIVTVNALYSRSELESVYRDIYTQEIDIEFDTVAINDYNNNIDLYIPEESNTRSVTRTVNELQVQYPFINVINERLSSEDEEPVANTPGARITISSGGTIFNKGYGGTTSSYGRATLGIWATLSNGTTGFITAGHVFAGTNSTFDSDRANVYANTAFSTVVGVASASRCFDAGPYDCAFVQLTSSLYTPTTGFASGGTITHVKEGIVTGMYVFKYGAGSGMAYGEIEYQESAVYEDHNDSYIINYDADNGTGTAGAGDSGGPVYWYDEDNYVRYLVGFVIAGRDGGGFQYAVRADRQLSKLGATIYTG